MVFIDNKEYIALQMCFLTKKTNSLENKGNSGNTLIIICLLRGGLEEFARKKMGKSLGNSVFIANFAVEFTRNLYSKKRNRKI